jgi:hypothetical protein
MHVLYDAMKDEVGHGDLAQDLGLDLNPALFVAGKILLVPPFAVPTHVAVPIFPNPERMTGSQRISMQARLLSPMRYGISYCERAQSDVFTRR